MNSTAWENVAQCADARAQTKTFNWDEDSSPLGDLTTREMARMLSYRSALIENIVRSFQQHNEFPVL